MDKTCDAREHPPVARRGVGSLLRLTWRTSAEYLTNRYSTSCIPSSSSRRRPRTSLTAACGVFHREISSRTTTSKNRGNFSGHLRAGHDDYIVNAEAAARRNLAARMIDHLPDRTSRPALPIRRLGGAPQEVRHRTQGHATEGAIDPVPCDRSALAVMPAVSNCFNPTLAHAPGSRRPA
jgi:hypothetical protein